MSWGATRAALAEWLLRRLFISIAGDQHIHINLGMGQGWVLAEVIYLDQSQPGAARWSVTGEGRSLSAAVDSLRRKVEQHHD